MPHAAGVTVLKTPLDDDKPTIAKQSRSGRLSHRGFRQDALQPAGAPGLHGFDQLMTEDDDREGWRRTVQPRAAARGRARQSRRGSPFSDPARIWLNAEKLPFPRYDDDMTSTFWRGRPCDIWRSTRTGRSPSGSASRSRTRLSIFRSRIRATLRPAQFPVPRVGPEDAWQIPLIFRDLTPTEKQGIIAAYYTSVTFLDRNVGVVLDELRRARSGGRHAGGLYGRPRLQPRASTAASKSTAATIRRCGSR